jgi:hypothetical protein
MNAVDQSTPLHAVKDLFVENLLDGQRRQWLLDRHSPGRSGAVSPQIPTSSRC